MKKRLLTALVVASLSTQLFAQGAVDFSKYDFTKLDDVLKVFEDSRLTRELNKSGTPAQKQAFNDTINGLYNKIDQRVQDKVQNQNKYKDKKVKTDDFSTPGASKEAKINTDRDVRMQSEVEPGLKKEVPSKYWEDDYYREFARETGFDGDLNNKAEVRKHAEKYRQLVTDKGHIEASLDYSDQNAKARSNILDVKSGNANLKDAEGLSRMYYEKGDEQLRQAQKAKQKLNNNPEMPEAEKLKLQDKINMHESESVAQIKKGVKALEEVREGMKKQGYTNLDHPNENFIKASEIIKEFGSTMSEDVDGLKAKLRENGFKDIEDFNQKLSVHNESLKNATPPPKKPASTDLKPVKTAKFSKMEALGKIGDIVSISQRLEKAKQGSYWLASFEGNDSGLETAGKALLIAGAELLPIPITDYMDRGFDVDERIKRMIELSIREGKPLSDAEIGLMMLGGAISEPAKMMVIEPVFQVFDAGKELRNLTSDSVSNYFQAADNEIAQKLNEERKEAYLDRKYTFSLGEIYKYKANGDIIVSPVKCNENIFFKIEKNENWTDKYRIKWELILPGRTITLKEENTSSPTANTASFTIVESLNSGLYTIRTSVFEKATNLFVDRREDVFTIAEKPFQLGNITALNRNTNQIVQGQVANDVRITFGVDKTPEWKGSQTIEWLINGALYKSKNALEDSSNLLYFSTTGESSGTYNVSARAIQDGKIIAHTSYNLVIKLAEIENEFKWEDWEEEVDDSSQKVADEESDTPVFIPDSNEVRDVLNAAAVKTSQANSNWSSRSSQAYSAREAHEKQMEQIEAEGQRQQQAIIAAHNTAMQEIKKQAESKPSFSGIEVSDNYTNTANSNQYDDQNEDSELQEQQAEEARYLAEQEQKKAEKAQRTAILKSKIEKLDMEIRNKIKIRADIDKKLWDKNAEPEKERKKAFAMCMDEETKKMGSWSYHSKSAVSSCHLKADKIKENMKKSIQSSVNAIENEIKAIQSQIDQLFEEKGKLEEELNSL